MSDLKLLLSATLISFKFFISPVYASTLIAHWNFEEGGGAIAYDSVNNLNGNIYGATYISGRVGNYALDFNGTSDYVQVANDPLLTPLSVGVSLWFKMRPAQQYEQSDLLDKGHGYGNVPLYGGYALQTNYGHSVVEGIQGNGSGYSIVGSNTTNTPLNDDLWHHLAFNSGADGLAIWIDGDLKDSLDSVGPLGTNDAPLSFGRHRSDLLRYFNGSLDDIQLYSGALTQADVNRLSTLPIPASIWLFVSSLISLFFYKKGAGFRPEARILTDRHR